jgi:hypothetical protein
MSFVSFVNSPVYLGTSEGQVPATGLAGISNLIAANSCEISFESSLEPAKYIGRNAVSDDFLSTSAQNVKISLSYLPLVGDNLNDGIQNASLLPLSLTGAFSETGHSIRVGNFLFNRCYLDSLSIQISPNTPIRWSTQFSCYDASSITGFNYTGFGDSGGFTSNSLSGTAYSAIHALTTNVSGSTSLPQSKTDISIQYQISRTPVYEIGSIVPRNVLLNTVSRTTNISAENIGEVIDFSGKSAILNLKFAEFGKLMNPSFDPSQDYRFMIGITGKINSQSLSMQPSKVVDGQISIMENLF